MLPVTDPRFSQREAAKHCILLEDHLQSPGKRCPDCIGKHLLAIEGYIEEACGLDKSGQHTQPRAADAVRALGQALSQGADPRQVAQGVRAIRKKLTGGKVMDGLSGPHRIAQMSGTPMGPQSTHTHVAGITVGHTGGRHLAGTSGTEGGFIATIGWAGSLAGMSAGAYHGYKRTGNAGWAIGWALFGGLLWPIAIPLMFAQGFAKRSR